MILDYHANTKAFTLTVDRHEADVSDLMTSHGLDFSTPLSTKHKAVMFTREPYAAVAFFQYATSTARAQLLTIQNTIQRSWAIASSRHIDVPADRELSPFQIAGVDYVLSQGNTLIGDQPGLGKAQPLWSRVLTPKGWREIGSLAEGDSICTSYGKQARIVGVYDRGVMPVWRVTFNDGAITYCSEDHLWKVRPHGPNDPHWFVAPAWEIKERLNHGQRLQVPIAEPHWGIEGPPPVSAYLVGLLLGDGGLSVRSRIMLSSADQEIIDRCKIIARYYGAKLVHHDRVDWRFNACAELRQRLDELGVMGHKSGTKRVPARYLQGSRKVRLETLQGLMDSDGWCTAEGNSGFASTSEGLADDVIALVRSLGGTARKSTKENCWSVSINIPVCPFWLQRKAERWAPFESHKPARWIRSIEPHSVELVRCISVASKDRLYITDDYVVTHNTMQAIAVANEMQAERVLVLCPANIRLQWCERIRAWTTLRYPYTVYPILHGRRGVHPTAEWTVISYDLARSEPIWRQLARGRYDLLILDEAHYLKTIDARRTRTVFGGGHNPAAEALAGRSSRILALTGTPLPNRPREAYTISRGLCWDAIDWMSEDRFTERFNPSQQRETPDGKIYIDERSGRHFELQARLRANFMVRRLKRDVLPQLKIPYLDIIHVEETGAVKQALQAEKLLDINPENMEGLDMTVRGQVSTVRRMMGLAIAPLAADYVEMLLDGGEEKIVVFAWHIEVLDILMNKLRKFKPLRIDGSTPAIRKPAIVKQFAQPGHRLLIGNILSMGTGTDGLQEACQRGVAAEASWVAGDNEQMVDRLDRMGQGGQVLFDFLVAPGSFSEHVLGSSLRKRKVTHTALDQRVEGW